MPVLDAYCRSCRQVPITCDQRTGDGLVLVVDKELVLT